MIFRQATLTLMRRALNDQKRLLWLNPKWSRKSLHCVICYQWSHVCLQSVDKAEGAHLGFGCHLQADIPEVRPCQADAKLGSKQRQGQASDSLCSVQAGSQLAKRLTSEALPCLMLTLSWLQTYPGLGQILSNATQSMRRC